MTDEALRREQRYTRLLQRAAAYARAGRRGRAQTLVRAVDAHKARHYVPPRLPLRSFSTLSDYRATLLGRLQAGYRQGIIATGTVATENSE